MTSVRVWRINRRPLKAGVRQWTYFLWVVWESVPFNCLINLETEQVSSIFMSQVRKLAESDLCSFFWSLTPALAGYRKIKNNTPMIIRIYFDVMSLFISFLINQRSKKCLEYDIINTVYNFKLSNLECYKINTLFEVQDWKQFRLNSSTVYVMELDDGGRWNIVDNTYNGDSWLLRINN